MATISSSLSNEESQLVAPIVEVPTRRYRESWNDYVARTLAWHREFIEKLQVEGRGTPMPYPLGLSDVASMLLSRLCYHCWNEEIEQFDPIRLSDRQAAALLGLTDRDAHIQAQSAIEEIASADLLSVEEPAIEHRRGALLRLHYHKGPNIEEQLDDPVMSGLSSDATELLYQLICSIPFNRIEKQFAPIRLSGLDAAALLGFTGRDSAARGQSVIYEMMAAGLLRIEKPTVRVLDEMVAAGLLSTEESAVDDQGTVYRLYFGTFLDSLLALHKENSTILGNEFELLSV